MLTAILIVRALLLVLAAVCLWKFRGGPLALFRGSQSLAQTGRAAQFFFALAVCIGQSFYLFMHEEEALLVALAFTGIALSLFLHISSRAKQKRLIKLDCLIDNPQWSLPLVELGEIDPALADSFADQVRQAIAVRKLA